MSKVRHKYKPGHSTTRQDVTLKLSPEQFPPLASSTSLILVLFCSPAPHVVEHSPSTQSPHSQSIGGTVVFVIDCGAEVMKYYGKDTKPVHYLC